MKSRKTVATKREERLAVFILALLNLIIWSLAFHALPLSKALAFPY